MKENKLNSIEDIRTYMGGDNDDVPVSEIAIEHLIYLIDQCKEYNLPLPEIFPWYGGDGVQAEWEYEDWYIEIDSSSKGISGLFLKEDDVSQYNFENIKDAFQFVKVFLKKHCQKFH